MCTYSCRIIPPGSWDFGKKLFYLQVQAPQSRFSLCLLQNNLCATDWPCVCCYSSWFIWLMTLLGDGCHPIPVSGKSSLHGTFKQSGSAQKSLEIRAAHGHKVLWMFFRNTVRKRGESFLPSKLISNNPRKYKDVQKNLDTAIPCL